MSERPLFVAPVPTSGRITRVLIANRGEIAVRVIRTCHELGLETVAVYSEPDAEAPHVRLATLAVCISPPSSQTDAPSPYLNADIIIKTAQETGCDALHPGYGYLSENADFADKVRQAGINFIGPEGDSIRTIGDKAASKAFLAKHAPDTVPLVPGYSGADQGVETLVREAKSIGYPLLIKASAGGGGKGMRIIRDESNLKDELQRAASESKRNFGDARLLLERYVDQGKHIEIQIFGDQHGNVYSFFERECSVQRRHQKIIEEAPSPALDQSTRSRMEQAARKIGELLRYQGAGTVEFIYDCRSNQFFFLEVNTRLQVEHPITELTTSLDLVSLQIFVAAGGNLSTLPHVTQVKQNGHAIECRLCAEDAFAEFAPRTGPIRLWIDGLANQRSTRSDTGVETGSEVTVFFDPMLAKLIVWGPDRPSAIARMASMLQHHVCLGVTTNQMFMLNCLRTPSFIDGSYTTAFIPSSIDSLLRPSVDALTASRAPKQPPNEALLAMAASVFLRYVRKHFQQLLKTLPPSWSNNPHDVTRANLEHLEIVRPDGQGSGYKLESPAQTEDAPDRYTFRVWADPAPRQQPEGAKKEPLKTMLVRNYYAGVASRDGLEDRSKGDWKIGVPESATSTHDVHASLVRATQCSNGSETWYHGYVRLTVGSTQETFFVATGDYSALTEPQSVSVFVHSRLIGGGVQIKRRDLLTFAGELDKRTAGSGDLSDGAQYIASMPCRILEIAAQDGATVSPGDTLLTQESMKTEIRLIAKAAGTVKMHVQEGDICQEGKLLCEIVPAE